MRTIGQLDSEEKAQRFSDFLVVQRIPNQIESGASGGWDIWVHSDDDLTKAAQHLAAFRVNPDDPQFAEGSQASSIREREQKEREEYAKKIRGSESVFRRFTEYRVGPLTALLIGFSVGIYIWRTFMGGTEQTHWLYFSEIVFRADFTSRLLGSPEIRAGEIWRLVTPMFLHFGILHIFFNMLWLRDLGAMIETVEGTGKFARIVLVSAAISNWAQYVISGPMFGGMSGVVYALLGYVWMMGKHRPGAGLYLHKDTVTMMLIWLVVCFTGLLGPIANWAHLGGLVVGAVWGRMDSKRP